MEILYINVITQLLNILRYVGWVAVEPIIVKSSMNVIGLGVVVAVGVIGKEM